MESQRVGHDWATFTFYCIGIRNKLIRKIFWERGSSQLPAPALFMLYYFTAPLMRISHVEHWHKHMHVCSVVSNSLWPRGLQPARLLCPWNFPGKNIGVGCHSFSRGPSWPRGQTSVSCKGRQVLYHCATREAPQSTGLGVERIGFEFLLLSRYLTLPTLISSPSN